MLLLPWIQRICHSSSASEIARVRQFVFARWLYLVLKNRVFDATCSPLILCLIRLTRLACRNHLRHLRDRIIYRHISSYLVVGGASHSFKCFTIPAEISEAVFLTVFSVAFFPMTNLASAGIPINTTAAEAECWLHRDLAAPVRLPY